METFVIRVWMPDEHEPDGQEAKLRGIVEHVRAGERRPFDGAAQLIAFVETVVARHQDPSSPHSEGDRP